MLAFIRLIHCLNSINESEDCQSMYSDFLGFSKFKKQTLDKCIDNIKRRCGRLDEDLEDLFCKITEHLGTIVDTDVPTEHLGSNVDTDVPTEHLGSVVDTDVPTKRLESIVHTDVPTEHLESIVHTDVPTEHLGSVVDTNADDTDVPTGEVHTKYCSSLKYPYT
jgi:hypothetical protein